MHFPEHGPLELTDLVVDGQVPAFTFDELQEAAGRLMLENQEGWTAIKRMVVTIIRAKCEYERERERRGSER